MTGDREYYNLKKDPYELHNLAPTLSASKIAALDRVLNGLIHCHGGVSCWEAGSTAKVR